MFEPRHSRLLDRAGFLRRQLRFAGISAFLVATALSIGTVGYHVFGALPWVDALLNAAMILTGMGPVDRMQTTAAKLFAAAYALFGGLAFITIVAVLFAPIMHRFLHALHLEEGKDDAAE